MGKSEFEERKRRILEKLRRAMENQEVDEPIIPLLNLINSHPNYVTTSSCAGRIVLMKIPENGKKWESEFIYKTHDEAKYEDVKNALELAVKTYKDPIWLKAESVILHVDCRTLDDCRKIIDIAREAGWKRSGLFLIRENRYVVELLSTEKLDVPIAKEGKILISDSYLKFLVEECNKKLRKTREKMRKFYELFKEKVLSNH